MSNKDFLKSIDYRCGTVTNSTALSVVSTAAAGVFMVFTVPLNAVIIYSLVKEHRKKYKSLFYKLLFNIAMADLLTGLIADPSAVNSTTKEALRQKIRLTDIYFIHVSLFFTDAVALLTLTVLSIERIIALVFPIKHHNGIRKRTENLLVISVWPLAMLLILPYFQIKFIRQLLVFSSINIIFTVLSLIVTTITYRYKLGVNKTKKSARERTNTNKEMDTKLQKPSLNESDGAVVFNKQSLDSLPDKEHQSQNVVIEKRLSNDRQFSSQQKATRTFILMLLVFVITYLPTTCLLYTSPSPRDS